MKQSRLATGLYLLASVAAIACERSEAPPPMLEFAPAKIELTRQTQTFVGSIGPIDVDFAAGERTLLFSGWTHDGDRRMAAGLWAGQGAASFALPLAVKAPLQVELVVF